MYLDRACLAWMLDSESFKADIPLSKDQANTLKSAFFWAYALAQVPAGWLAERFGKRALMTVLILLWSGFTALSGFSNGIVMLFVARIGCGLAAAS
jgi:MFS family permease